jgi:hypothetical protein
MLCLLSASANFNTDNKKSKFQLLSAVMSAYIEIICPCTTRQARYKKFSPDTPSGNFPPSLSLGTGISTHCMQVNQQYK